MKTSSDQPDSADAPLAIYGPLRIILSTLRSPLNHILSNLNQLQAAGPLNEQQTAYHQDAMRLLMEVAHTVDQYAPQPTQARAVAASGESWNAGEISDALDDRYQDAPMPLDDRPGRDGEQP